MALKVYDDRSGSERVHLFNVVGQPLTLRLLKKTPKTLEFNIGDKLIMPLPTFNHRVTYQLEGDLKLAKVEGSSLVICGGKGTD
jgi:hypothetical protein